MKCIKKGKAKLQKFRGTCIGCGGEYEAEHHELKVETCPKEHYDFAHHPCPDCQGNILFYPK